MPSSGARTRRLSSVVGMLITLAAAGCALEPPPPPGWRLIREPEHRFAIALPERWELGEPAGEDTVLVATDPVTNEPDLFLPTLFIVRYPWTGSVDDLIPGTLEVLPADVEGLSYGTGALPAAGVTARFLYTYRDPQAPEASAEYIIYKLVHDGYATELQFIAPPGALRPEQRDTIERIVDSFRFLARG